MKAFRIGESLKLKTIKGNDYANFIRIYFHISNNGIQNDDFKIKNM